MKDKEIQLIAVEKVLKEMLMAEEYVRGWNASWYEQCADAYSSDLCCMGESDILDFQEKYHDHYVLQDVKSLENRIGEPLRKVVLVGDFNDEYECEFGKIAWEGMCSKKAIRSFCFSNDGKITFTKDDKKKEEKRRNRKLKDDIYTSYDATYNVLSDDFNLNVTVDRVVTEKYSRRFRDYIEFSRCGDIVIKRLNDIYIYQDLKTNDKIIKIEKGYRRRNKSFNSSVSFEAVFDSFDTFQKGAVEIKTYKGNGKVNGTYRFDVSREKGARANFYSRKGVKVDLIHHPELLKKANLLLSAKSPSTGDMVISKFADSTQQAVANSLGNRVISFDATDFTMDAVSNADKRVVGTIKNIQGELPLYGLNQRISDCFQLMCKTTSLSEERNIKVLEKR